MVAAGLRLGRTGETPVPPRNLAAPVGKMAGRFGRWGRLGESVSSSEPFNKIHNSMLKASRRWKSGWGPGWLKAQ
jgi:hypothetical protein